MDFSIVAVIESVDSTNFTYEYGKDRGPGRTLVYWQIYNHSSDEIQLKHKHIEHIGKDQVAYNQDAKSPHVATSVQAGEPKIWEEIAEDNRLRYVCLIEIPVWLGAIR
jgi:hypothetical protein